MPKKHKPDRHRSCEPKQRFASKRAAEAAARAMFKSRLSKVWPYHCSFCDGFHIGHKPRWGRKPRKRR